MLIALLAATLLGGGNAPFFDKETRAAIQEVVVDTERQKEALAAIKRVEDARKKPNKGAEKARKDLGRLEADLSAEAEEIRAAYDVILEFRAEVGQAYTDTIFDMRESMTEEEWQAVFGSDS